MAELAQTRRSAAGVGPARSLTLPTLSRAHGVFNVATGLWPVVHMRSFEAVSGPKVDRWLVRTVGWLMAANGLAQLTAREQEQRLSARVGLGMSAVLAAIDLRYGSTGRISRMYLLDAAVQVTWMAVWSAALQQAQEPRLAPEAAVTGPGEVRDAPEAR